MGRHRPRSHSEIQMRDIHFHAQLTQTSLLTKHRPRINRTPVGFDIKKVKLPISHKKFIALLNRKCRDGVKIHGKELTGDDLFRAFMRDYLPEAVAIFHGSFVRTAHGIFPEIETRPAVIEEMVDKSLGFYQRKGWSKARAIVSMATDFACWRAERVSRNKVRTKGNLNKGVLKKGEKNNQKKV